jgi:hemolysin III
MSKQPKKQTIFSTLRDPISAVLHMAGAGIAVIGAIVLLSSGASGAAATLALMIYAGSLVLLFLSSGIYHALIESPRVIEALRKLDHSAIYVLIAGSYTPFCVLAFSGFWRWGFLALIWTLALIGIVTKLFIIDAPRWVTAGIYVCMGWLSIFAVREMITALPGASLGWLLAGGVIYTLGALIYITKRLDLRPGVFGFHEVWHVFVLLGAAAHFLAIYNLVLGVPLG